MAISYTKTQRQVIETRGCNLLVSAAAGSGKTAVLVERIVRMVSDEKQPVDIDRLLVVTFTKAAASEMRERIGRALNDRLSQEPENEHLQRQVTLLHNAQITTIDSFCLFVIRNQFHTIGLDPGFRIAEEGEGKLLMQDVLEKVLEDEYAKGEPAFLNCMEYFSTGSRDNAVEEVILKLYDFAMSNPFPERWLEERKKDYRITLSEKMAESRSDGGTSENIVKDSIFEDISWVTVLMEQTRRILSGCIEKLTLALGICEESDGPYPYGAVLEREKEMVEAILSKCDKNHDIKCDTDYDVLYTAFETVQFDRLPSKKDVTISPVKRELVKNIRAEVKDTLTQLKERYFFQTKEQTIRQMESCQAAVEALIDLVLAFKKAFDDKKREKNLLDFDDIEHFALSILLRVDQDGQLSATETALEYRSYFQEILIDEYQDSNLVQEYLLSCISGEDEGKYNRFMVGDVKQSIYKFRMARPELFLEKYNAYADIEDDAAGDAADDTADDAAGDTADDAADDAAAESFALCGAKCGKVRIDLHQNFRSRYEILNSTNAVFGRIMGKETGGIVYDEQAALHTGADYPESSGNQTELLLFMTQEKPEEISVKEQEAYGVAMRIKRLMREFQVTDKETGKLRRLSYRDIVILLRTASGWDEVFKNTLEKEQIPVHMTSRTGYFAADEVQQLLHFLRVLDNPLQDIPFYGVLHSCLGGFTEEEIALVRASYPKKKYLFDAFVSCGEKGDGNVPDQISDELAEKIRNFLAKIERYRDLAAYFSVHELLQTILRETDYLNLMAAKPEGNKRRANVEMLLVKAKEYQRTSYFGLYHFLRYIEQLEKYEVDYGEAGLEDENADVVRIMSIHKSKGLEFPVCIVAGLAKSFQKKDTTAQLVADVDAGIGVDYVNSQMRVRGKNLRKNVIADKIWQDSLAEEIRILYVAMTRAKEKLILTGALKSPEKKAMSLLLLQKTKGQTLPYDTLLSGSGLLDLLLAALSGNRSMDEFYARLSLEPDQKSEWYDRDMSFQVILSGWEEPVEEALADTVYKEQAKRKLILSDRSKDIDEELMAHMSQTLLYRYPHDNLKNLYTKTTVSELKKAGMWEQEDFSFQLYEEEPVEPYLPKFIRREENVSGSQRGTAFHKVMELFDFAELTEEVSRNTEAVKNLLKSRLDQMLAEGRLTRECYDAVSIPKIAAFLESDIALRMGRAARAGRLYKEQPFVLGIPADRLGSEFPPNETVLIQGIIDVFFEEEDQYVLLDYKTDAVQTPEELVNRYQVQLDYYAEALEQMSGYRQGGGGKKVGEKIIYSFKLGREIYLRK